jgi:hypothetical protein
LATTAKPLPASPARAASTPALRASRLGLECNAFDQGDDLVVFLVDLAIWLMA